MNSSAQGRSVQIGSAQLLISNHANGGPMTAQLGLNPFSGAWLERRSEARAEPKWAARAQSEPGTRFLVSRGTRQLVRSDDKTAIAFLSIDHPLIRATDPDQWVLLGWWQNSPCVLVELPAPTVASPSHLEFPPGTHLSELRPLLAALPAAETAVLTCARALSIWRARHRFCGACAAPTTLRAAGHSLRCANAACGAEIFPRLDPAVIVIVSDGDQILLGRQTSMPPGLYSALAGFVEPGESLEDTVLREVFEETGVRAHAPRYYASQPWPFPSSLMLGFHATADRTAPIELDGELEEARWFSAADLAHTGEHVLPPRFSISRRLIDAWYAQITGAALPAG